MAANKGERDIAMGNIIGSNLFNILFVLGASATIHPIMVDMVSVVDIALLIVVSLISYLFSYTKTCISRVEGAIMTLIYVGYMAYILIR